VTREVRLLVMVMIACLVVMTTRAPADAQTASELRALDVDVSDYPTVALTFDMPDIIDGSWTATVLERDASRPAEILAGTRGGNEVALVIDTSGSMAGAPLAAAKSAAIAFVHQLPSATRAAVVAFGGSPYVVSPMTADPAVLEAAITGLRASGDTALYDALGVAAAQFSLSELPRSIVLVSDGGDTASVAPLEDVTARLVEASIRVFGLRLVTEETNDGVLAGLAAATHGRTADAVDPASLLDAYQTIAGSALRQVRLTYQSAAHGKTSIEVRLEGGGVQRTATVELDLPALPVSEITGSAPRPTARTEQTTEPNTSRLVVGATALFLALLALGYQTFVGQPKSLLAGGHRRSTSTDWAEVKSKVGAAMERTLERQGRREALGARLEHAGIALRPGEYLLMTSAMVGAGWFAGLVLGGVLVANLFGVIAVVTAWVLLRTRTTKRRTALDRQLPELLQQLTSSLRAGYGIMQALDSVARESEEPMRSELRRVVHEVQLGRALTESLERMATRVGGQDFAWVVQAIEINHEVGGDLVEVLDSVADTIRARAHLRRQIRTLSAQGRLSARILVAMPFILGALLSLLHPGWLTPLFAEPAGRVTLMVGGVMLLVGGLWMRRIVRLQF
jgi:tight adherence protein B